MSDHDEAIADFIQLTAATPEQAAEYLSGNHWDVSAASNAFFADLEEEEAEEASRAVAAADAAYTGPRTLDGRPAPQHASSSSSAAKKPPKRTGLATLGSLRNAEAHDDDDDDDDDDSDDEGRRGPRDLFAGGEKSGLAVQDPAQRSSDPRRLISDIVSKAKANARQQPEPDSPAGPSSSRFRGAGQTLGGDGTESRRIPDPLEATGPTTAVPEGPLQERILHIWADGFSVDDGELRRFDDPQNQADLRMIREGRAPLHLMNVRFDQRVDVKLQQHQENWKPLPKVYRPFSGEGRRLGSPVPGDTTAVPSAPIATTQTTPAASSEAPTTGFDASQPALNLRVQLPDGTRLPARFNTTQTVGDVYDFIQRASPSLNRPWVLSTTFPNKEHEDKGLVLGEMAEFKRGGTAVVKWR
ncbi:hypothetical protein QBC38DRAFT_485296 [Podospora fimiseda]|uniref:UBX domain-containing protein 1 n=1 Tax=Podospora fimiseda TaxID=252190 RepID=A0AAN7BJN0_9PEZI|nr:hypothetical protein QBC38DRAFT_485296 [Podospora fimiseda]